MPVYDARLTHNPNLVVPAGVAFPAEPFPAGGARVRDADGKPVLMCRRVCTETGEVERYDYDLKTRKFRLGADGRLVIVAERRPAPLTVTPLAPGEMYLDHME